MFIQLVFFWLHKTKHPRTMKMSNMITMQKFDITIIK